MILKNVTLHNNGGGKMRNTIFYFTGLPYKVKKFMAKVELDKQSYVFIFINRYDTFLKLIENVIHVSCVKVYVQ
jgi:hypothetical protein